MSAQTKIIVLRMKRLILAGILTGVSLFVILLIAIILTFGKEKTPSALPTTSSKEALYIPGVYTTGIHLGGESIDVEVSVDSDRILTLRLVNLTDNITTMYPLLEPTFESLCSKICEEQSLDNITYSGENKYTSIVLLDAIRTSLDKAKVRPVNALLFYTDLLTLPL